jgi:hypothetical protein
MTMGISHRANADHVGRHTELQAANAIMDYRGELGLQPVKPASDCCLHCRSCEWRIGSQACGDKEFDPIKLMAIAEKFEVTIKLTVTLNYYVVCVLPRQGEALIYG